MLPVEHRDTLGFYSRAVESNSIPPSVWVTRDRELKLVNCQSRLEGGILP